MQYSKLGSTGLTVSRLALGAMTFGQGEGRFASIYKLDRQQSDAIVGRAIDGGINFFNSADAYASGQSEEILGQALGARRHEMIIATKVGGRFDADLNNSGLSRRHIIASAEASLRRLGTDWIDVYLAHRMDPLTPLEETLSAFEHLVQSGKVRYIGFSNWPAWLAAKAIATQKLRGQEPFRAAEVYYSLVGRDLEKEIMPMAADAGAGLIIWSPLAGGFLSAKYPRGEAPREGGRLVDIKVVPQDPDKDYPIIDVLRQVAARHGVAPATVAIAWLLNKPVSSVIVGATKPEQLDDTIAASDLRLSPEDIAVLDTVSASPSPYPHWMYEGVINDRKLEKALGLA